MKTTIELPDALLRSVKLRAVCEGRKLKDVVADLLRRGLDAADAAPSMGTRPFLTVDSETGLPIVACRHAAARGQELTADRVAAILLEQEVEGLHDAAR